MTSNTDIFCADRVTLGFDEEEDRMSLACVGSGGSRLLWLTARLARNLVPHLLNVVATSPVVKTRHTGEPSGPEALSLRASEKQAVKVTDDMVSSVIATVDITHGPMLVQMQFRNARDNTCVQLILEHAQLSRWLEGLRKCFNKADWPMQCWHSDAENQDKVIAASSNRVLIH